MRARFTIAIVAGMAILGYAAFRFWPRPLPAVSPVVLAPAISFMEGKTVAAVPSRALVQDVTALDDELLAYLMFGYYRGVAARNGLRSWLTYERKGKSLDYIIRMEAPNDLVAAFPYLYGLRRDGLLSDVAPRWVHPDTVSRFETQTYVFDTAYNLPARPRFETIPRRQLVAYMKRFIRFKAETDARVRRGTESLARPPDRVQARRLAEDIVTIADFYGLPLDFFLGIGAMENNYMHVKGDLGNAAWKRRAEKGDVVLKRGPKGVLVLNESSGIWQITRETLRHAHRRFLKDTRDYTLLPEHLRPPRQLNLDDVPPEVLTTCAGLFFRELLDRFSGDVALAVGAYNGGPGRPNPAYEAGVRAAADHARRVLEHAAALQDRPAAGMLFLTASQ